MFVPEGVWSPPPALTSVPSNQSEWSLNCDACSTVCSVVVMQRAHTHPPTQTPSAHNAPADYLHTPCNCAWARERVINASLGGAPGRAHNFDQRPSARVELHLAAFDGPHPGAGHMLRPTNERKCTKDSTFVFTDKVPRSLQFPQFSTVRALSACRCRAVTCIISARSTPSSLSRWSSSTSNRYRASVYFICKCGVACDAACSTHSYGRRTCQYVLLVKSICVRALTGAANQQISNADTHRIVGRLLAPRNICQKQPPHCSRPPPPKLRRHSGLAVDSMPMFTMVI